jgi:hypothetical protein
MIKLIIFIAIAIQTCFLCSQPAAIVHLKSSKKQIKEKNYGDVIYPNYIPAKFY